MDKFLATFRAITDDPAELLQRLTALFLEIRKMDPDKLIALWQTLCVIEEQSPHPLIVPFKKAVLQAMQDSIIEKGYAYSNKDLQKFSGATGHHFTPAK